MSACDLAEIITALDTIYYSFAVTTVLDLLDRYWIEVFFRVVDVNRVFIVDKGVAVVVWKAKYVFSDRKSVV